MLWAGSGGSWRQGGPKNAKALTKTMRGSLWEGVPKVHILDTSPVMAPVFGNHRWGLDSAQAGDTSPLSSQGSLPEPVPEPMLYAPLRRRPPPHPPPTVLRGIGGEPPESRQLHLSRRKLLPTASHQPESFCRGWLICLIPEQETLPRQRRSFRQSVHQPKERNT